MAFCNEFEYVQNITLAQGILEMKQGPLGACIRSFFETGDFSPRLILKDPETYTYTEDSGYEYEEHATLRIGDVRMIGTRYELEGVHSASVLPEHIAALGDLYLLARRLRLDAVIDKIIMKLQAVAGF